MLDAGGATNDDMQTAASVFPSDSQNVCSSIVKTEDNIDKSTDVTDSGSAAVKETCVQEKESSPKHSETSQTSPAKRSAEMKNGGTKQPAL